MPLQRQRRNPGDDVAAEDHVRPEAPRLVEHARVQDRHRKRAAHADAGHPANVEAFGAIELGAPLLVEGDDADFQRRGAADQMPHQHRDATGAGRKVWGGEKDA